MTLKSVSAAATEMQRDLPGPGTEDWYAAQVAGSQDEKKKSAEEAAKDGARDSQLAKTQKHRSDLSSWACQKLIVMQARHSVKVSLRPLEI